MSSRIRWMYVLAAAGVIAGSAALLAISARRRLNGAVLAAAPVQLSADGELALPMPVAAAAVQPEAQRATRRRAHPTLAAVCVFFAIFMVILGAIRFQAPGGGTDEAIDRGLTWALVMTLGGAGLLGLALRLANRPALPTPTRLAMNSPRPRIRRTALGVFLLALTAEISGGLLRLDVLSAVSEHVQMALFLGGVALATWGLSGIRLVRPHPPASSPSGRRGAEVPLPQGEGFRVRAQTRFLRLRTSPHAIEALTVLGITLLALILRAWQVGDLIHTYVDEVLFIEAINEINANPTIPMMLPVPGISTIVGLYPYMQRIGVDLFGATNLTGIRALAVLMGALTVPGLYVLARELFNRKTAVVAALLLATFPPALHFSRLSLFNIADPLFGTWALAFLARGLRCNRRADYALAGTMLGLTHYFYEGGRLLFTLLVIGWIVLLILVGGWRKLHWQGLATMLLTFLLAVMPMYYAWAAHGIPFSPRYDEQRAVEGQRLRSLNDQIAWFGDYLKWRLKPPLLHFVSRPDGSGFYYGGQTPMLLAYTAPLFLLGLAYVIWRIRPSISGKTVGSPGALLLPLWLAATVIGNSLLITTDWTVRYVPLFPALALTIAIGLVGGLGLLLPSPTRAGQRSMLPKLRTALTAVIVGALCVLQPLYYFGAHVPYYNRQLRAVLKDHLDVAFRLLALPDDTKVYIIGDDLVWEAHYPSLATFWGRDLPITWLKPEALTNEYIFKDMPRDANLAFFIEPSDIATWKRLQEFYTVEPPAYSPYNVPTFGQYVLLYAPLDRQASP